MSWSMIKESSIKESSINRFTLIIDCNWLLQSRFSVLSKGFLKDNPDRVKEHAKEELRDLLARSINVILNRFQAIDNIVLVEDGGSWRKRIVVSDAVGEVDYKSNREESRAASDFDWAMIFSVLDDLAKTARSLGITVTRDYEVEGDDWCWYWSKLLNSRGINCLIWSSDCDLKQLVNYDSDNATYTIWYNDKNGVWIPESLMDDSNDIDFFMKPQPDNQVLEDIKRKSKCTTYFNPDLIVIKKTICGDAGDMVMPCIRYRKGQRVYGVGCKDYEKLIKELSINTLSDFFEKIDKVIDWLLSQNKYKGLGLTREGLKTRLRENLRLVWLSKSSYPKDILEKMDKMKDKYNVFDISYIKSNYRCLVPADTNEIENIFEEAEVGTGTNEDLPF